MKKTIQLGISALSILLLATACLEDVAAPSRGQGSLNLEVGVDHEMVSALKAPQSRAGETDGITPEELDLVLTKKDGSFKRTYTAGNWFSVTDKFTTGDYTLEAVYGDSSEEGFGCPHFHGTTELTVRDSDEPSTVSLTATPADALLKIVYGDKFTGYMTDWGAEVETALGTRISYSSDETREADIMPGQAKVNVSFTKPNGNKAKMPVATYTLEAGHRYLLTIDMDEDAGSAEFISISLDDNMETEPIEVNISDAIFNAPAPVATAEGFTPGETMSIVEGTTPAQPLLVSVVAQAGLAQVTLRTESESLAAQGWPAEIDLLSADAAMQQKLQSLGLKAIGLWKNVGEMAQIDLTDVLSHLTGKASFTVEAMDKVNRLTDAITLSADIEALAIEFSADDVYSEGEDIMLNVNYNGTGLADLLSFEYDNVRGTRSPLEIASVEGPLSRAMAGYTVTLRAPAAATVKGDNSIHIYAYFNKEAKGDFVIKGAPFEIIGEENDFFATYAYVKVVGTEGEPDPSLSGASFLVNGTAASHTIEGEYVKISGLTPGKAEKINVVIDGMRSKPFTVHTEAAAQIPNGNLDAAAPIDGSGKNWENYVFEGWGTNNPMTTSLHSNDFAYDAISGTKPTTDAVKGSAVQIRTNGWGKSNTALSGVKGVCAHIDPGMLHLGSSRSVRPAGFGGRPGPLTTDDLDCGIAFASRPSGLTFHYKYNAKNQADHGEVEILVMDAEGNILSNARQDLGSRDQYGEVTLPLSYARGSSKAGKIYVRFLSTNVSNALEKDAAWLNGPGLMNLSRGEYSGSTLFVDEITLNY